MPWDPAQPPSSPQSAWPQQRRPAAPSSHAAAGCRHLQGACSGPLPAAPRLLPLRCVCGDRDGCPALPCPALHQTGVTGTCPVLLSLIPDWDWCKWELSAVQALGAGVTTHVLGTCRGTPRSCSPDELCQLPGLHQAVGQVGVLLPAVLGMQLEREGKQRGCDSHADTCPAPRLPANPPNPSEQSLPTPLSLCHPHWGEPGMLTPLHNQLVGPCPTCLSNILLNQCIVQGRVRRAVVKQGDSKRGVRPLIPLLPIVPPMLGSSLRCSRG